MPFSTGTRRGASRWGSSSLRTIQDNDPYSVENLERQIANTRLRAQDAGYDANPDKRNWFEKATNLPKGQNALLDTLEIISRPGQAALNVIDKTSTGERDILDAAWRGFSGKDRVRGTDIVEKRGIDNGFSKFLLGSALEIAADPINLVPGGAIVKGATALGSGAKQGYNALENIAPKLRQIREDVVQPRFERAKDSLGYMFNRDYKIDETLSGEKSNFLRSKAQEADNTRRFMQEESLKTIADAAKLTGGVDTGVDVGRLMESSLKQHDEGGRLLERPARELSSNPQIKEAATTLTRSNQLLRQFALENGIQIPELEGYMTHVWSKAERELRKKGRIAKVDQGRFGLGNPNKKILNRRELMGSAEDVNEQVGRQMFEPNAYFASGIGQKRLIDYVTAVKFRREVLSNPDFAIKYEKGMVVPPNAEVVDTAKYSFLKDADDPLGEIGSAEEIGGKYVVTKAAKRALDRYQRLNTDEGTKAFIKAFDTATNTWKKFALFSIGYHARNAMGGLFNNYVGGMNLYNGDLAKYTAQAGREVAQAIRGKESPLYREYRQQGLGSTSLSNVEFRPYNEPEKAIENTIKQRSKDTKGQVTSRLNPLRAFETSREAGNVIDQTNRFAAYKWAREKLKLSPEQAAAKTREMQFDYTNLSPMEQSVMVRVIPFYRWMRNNIPYQIRQFIHDPSKYTAVNKIRLNAMDAAGIEEDNTPDWMKEQFAIPVSEDKFLSLGLPLGDLAKITNPLKMGVDSLNPLVKTPIELSTNTNFFFNKPIERFEGQEKQFQVPGTDVGFGIPIKAAYVAEQATGQIGRGFSQYLQKPEDVDQDTKFRMPTLGISSIFKEYDTAQALKSQKLQELRELQDYLDYIEQQSGLRPRTVREIEKGQ